MRFLAKLLSPSRSTPPPISEPVGRALRSDSTSADSVEGNRLIDEAGADVAAGRYARALACVDTALRVAPDDADLVFARASTLFSWGRYREAFEAHQRAERLGLASGALYTQRGWAAYWIGRTDEALASMRVAVEKSPDDWATHFGLAAMLRAIKLLDESLGASKRALELKPDDFYCMAGLAACEVELGLLNDAETHAHRIVELHADNPLAWSTLGGVLDHQSRFDEALAAHERCEALGGTSPQAADEYFHRVICLLHAGRTRKALALLERKLPRYSNARAQGQYALALLTAGRMTEGWNQYEFRWMEEPLSRARPKFTKPVWTGEDLRGRTILLRTEQGHGDFIQFIRYARHVKALGAEVLLELREEMRPLAEQLAEVDRILRPNEPYPTFDFYVSLMSLPRAFGTDVVSVPAEVPYLRVDSRRRAEWGNRLGSGARLNVGLVWAGSPTHPRDRMRSVALESLAPLATVEGVRFYSLQKGPAAHEADAPPASMDIVDVGSQLRDFGDTAAVVERLDLVITIDTSVAHLAGALGKPVWVLLPKPADFRWLEDREDSPWYPTMRLFRQRDAGVWDAVIARVAHELHNFASCNPGRALETTTDVDLQFATPTLRPLHPRDRASVQGLSEVAETRLGIMQYFPEQTDVGPSVRRYGEYLQRQLDLLAHVGIAHGTILEAAAGVGYHALFLASAIGPTGHLVLYEDDDLVQRALKQNLASNRITNTTVMRRALRGSRRTLSSAPGTLANVEAAASAAEIPETIDELRLETLEWLKLNDGVEVDEVLDGASETIWRSRPKLFIAAQDDESLQQIAKRVRDFGYSCWRTATPLFNPDNFNLCPDDVFRGKVALALLAVPEESGLEIAVHSCERIA